MTCHLKSLLQDQPQADLGYCAKSNVDQTSHDSPPSIVPGLIEHFCKIFNNNYVI